MCTYREEKTIVVDLEFFRFAGVSLAYDGIAADGLGDWVNFGGGRFEISNLAIDLLNQRVCALIHNGMLAFMRCFVSSLYWNNRCKWKNKKGKK